MNKQLQAISEIIKNYKSFSIYAHMNTDFDAVCSCLSLQRVLEKMSKIAHVFIDSELPNNVGVLEGWQKINAEKQSSYDVAVVLDCGDEQRLGRNNYKYKRGVKTTICIDHHSGTQPFAKNCYIVEGASSTCELLYNLFQYMGVEIDKATAKLLISGIYTDTGSLQYSNTHLSTFDTVKNLLQIADCKMDTISTPIFASISSSAFKLRAICYNKIELYENGQIAITSINADDFERTNATFRDTEGLVDVARQLESVRLLALMSENPDERGTFRISLRSKGDRSARNVAMAFGGGGHEQASGCRIMDSEKNVKAMLLKELKRELKR